MSKKKIRQGQSRWIAWVYQDVKRDSKGMPDGFSRINLGVPEPAKSNLNAPLTYTIQRLEVVSAHNGQVVVKFDNHSNTATFSEADWRACASSRNVALRKVKEHQAMHSGK